MSAPRLAFASLTAFAVALATRDADACGGFFCDQINGVPTPVDQTGENILFVVDRDAGTVEAHIQIQYTGAAAKFAWVIPVSAVPDFSVGAEALFTNLLASTVPVYGYTRSRDCADDDKRQVGCGYAEDAGSFEDSGSLTGTGAGEDTGPQVVKREIVGAFEVVVLQGGTAEELNDWLNTFGYYQDPDAAPIVAQYLKEGFYFAAAKLRNGAGVDELQPLVLKYKGDQPCVPLRLTRIAAKDDMPVRVFALGEARAVPSNYRHIALNEVRLDWQNFADDYNQIVARAIDTPGADGQAFVTEYAGPSDAVVRSGLYDPLWDPTAFAASQPVDVVDRLTAQNLLSCYDDFDLGAVCTFLHPQVLPLLRRYVPAPAEVDEAAFWTCLSCYADQLDPEAWSGPAFAKDMQERIVDPGKHAVDLLGRWPYLSRLLTILSPHEMTVDPEFILNDDLPEVVATRNINASTPCAGSDRYDIDDDHSVLTNPDGSWPTFDKSMPYALRIEQMTPSGAPQVLMDYQAPIEEALHISNNRFTYDNGRGLGCSIRPASWLNAMALGVVFVVALRGRRRRLS